MGACSRTCTEPALIERAAGPRAAHVRRLQPLRDRVCPLDQRRAEGAEHHSTPCHTNSRPRARGGPHRSCRHQDELSPVCAHPYFTPPCWVGELTAADSPSRRREPLFSSARSRKRGSEGDLPGRSSVRGRYREHGCDQWSEHCPPWPGNETFPLKPFCRSVKRVRCDSGCGPARVWSAVLDRCGIEGGRRRRRFRGAPPRVGATCVARNCGSRRSRNSAASTIRGPARRRSRWSRDWRRPRATSVSRAVSRPGGPAPLRPGNQSAG